jgi:3-hydroxybutyryl-CoA dehydratase
MMATPFLPNRIPQSASVGARASFTRTLTEADAALFIGVTWDINPLHTDESYARRTRFKQRIIPGLLTASLLTHLGGLWAFMATEMHFEFLAPVYPGETITATAEVIEADPSRNWVRLRCTCTNQDGAEVLHGDVFGFPGKFAA